MRPTDDTEIVRSLLRHLARRLWWSEVLRQALRVTVAAAIVAGTTQLLERIKPGSVPVPLVLILVALGGVLAIVGSLQRVSLTHAAAVIDATFGLEERFMTAVECLGRQTPAARLVLHDAARAGASLRLRGVGGPPLTREAWMAGLALVAAAVVAFQPASRSAGGPSGSPRPWDLGDSNSSDRAAGSPDAAPSGLSPVSTPSPPGRLGALLRQARAAAGPSTRMARGGDREGRAPRPLVEATKGGAGDGTSPAPPAVHRGRANVDAAPPSRVRWSGDQDASAGTVAAEGVVSPGEAAGQTASAVGRWGEHRDDTHGPSLERPAAVGPGSAVSSGETVPGAAIGRDLAPAGLRWYIRRYFEVLRRAGEPEGPS